MCTFQSTRPRGARHIVGVLVDGLRDLLDPRIKVGP